jgi:hypothetical protein
MLCSRYTDQQRGKMLLTGHNPLNTMDNPGLSEPAARAAPRLAQY